MARATDYSSIDTFLSKHPRIKSKYDKLDPEDQITYKDLFLKEGSRAAKRYMNKTLNITEEGKETREAAPGVHVPVKSKYPTGILLFEDEEGNKLPAPELPDAEYDYVGGVRSTTTDKVAGISTPDYVPTPSITGTTLKKTDKVIAPGYEGAEGINQYTAEGADYNMVDPMSFASEYGAEFRNEVLKNASLADQIALQQLETELGGMMDYTRAAAALKRQETSIDNAFNQAQRLRQVEQAVPDVQADLAAQRERASAYAEGRLPDEMEDRMMELNIRSRAADQSGAAGFGAGSVAAQKASTLMSAEQRLGVAQMGEQLMSQNMQARTELNLAPTEYITAGQQISVMPSQSASVLSASAMGQLNELANVSATTALSAQISQEQFGANLANDISQFNAAIQQDTEKFNSTMAENQAQFKASMQAQIEQFNAQLESSENLSQAEIEQRTQEFNASMSTRQQEFQAQMQQAIESFNAQLAVNQNQFNAQISQRTNEFNANLATQQNQFVTSLGQRTAEFNTTMEYNTAVANVGIQNAFKLGAFDYDVSYNGLIAGALNKNEDTKLQLELAEKELAIYQDALMAQLELEQLKLEIARQQLEG